MQETIPPAFKLKVFWPNPGQTLPSYSPSLDRQTAITVSSLIKPQTPVLRSPLLSPLRAIQGEAELEPTSTSRAPRGTSGTLPPVQEEPCLAHSGRHRAWRARGQLHPSPRSWPQAHQGWQQLSWPQCTPLERKPSYSLLSSWPAESPSYWLKSLFLFNLSLTIFPLAGEKGLQSYSVRAFL